MSNLPRKFINKAYLILNSFSKSYSQPKKSYSQSGEDLIIQYIFNSLKIKTFSYLDIGAYHPYTFSNTALFYLKGCRGINIEPNPELFQVFLRERKKDINLNIGIATTSGELDFYFLSAPTLSTFSREEAERYVQDEGFSLRGIKKIPVRTVSEVVAEYCQGQIPELLSLDAEGLDLTILKSIDYEQSSPIVICVETISFSNTGHGVKDQEIIDFLETQGYMTYADTYINTIFVKKDKWIR